MYRLERYNTHWMSAKDKYHDSAVTALVKDGWKITHDPLTLRYGRREVFVDLGAEQIFAAERGTERIAVKVKSFIGDSEMEDLRNALGQFVFYRNILEKVESDRKLFLAIRASVYESLFAEPIGQLFVENGQLQIIVFNEHTEEITKWLPPMN